MKNLARSRTFIDRFDALVIHVSGANIGTLQRHVFDEATGTMKPFVSGYDGIMPRT